MNYEPKQGKHLWRGDEVGYYGIHHWLAKHYGRATRCESNTCKKNCSIFQWALKRGEEYARRRENFIQLCVACHSLYDGKIQALAEKKWKAVKGKKSNISVRFVSAKEASRVLGISKTAISNNLHGRSRSAGGFQWTYA